MFLDMMGHGCYKSLGHKSRLKISINLTLEKKFGRER